MSSWPIRDDASKVFPLYSRANVGEIFPDPISPLNASAGFQHNLEAGWRDAFVNCGVWDHDLYDASVERNILPAFGSYLYINMSLMRLFGVRVPGMGPEAVDLQYFGDMPGIPSYASERRDFDDNPGYQAKAGAWLMEKVLGATDLAEYDADRELVLGIRAGRPDLAALSGVALDEALDLIEVLADDLGALARKLADLIVERIWEPVSAVGGPGELTDLLRRGRPLLLQGAASALADRLGAALAERADTASDGGRLRAALDEIRVGAVADSAGTIHRWRDEE